MPTPPKNVGCFGFGFLTLGCSVPRFFVDFQGEVHGVPGAGARQALWDDSPPTVPEGPRPETSSGGGGGGDDLFWGSRTSLFLTCYLQTYTLLK